MQFKFIITYNLLILIAEFIYFVDITYILIKINLKFID